MQMVKYLNEKLQINEQNKWKAVVDFSAFKWRDVQSVLKVVNNLAERYIYISTDSVYNNQKERLELPVKEDTFDIEEECQKQRKYDKKNDKYGYVILYLLCRINSSVKCILNGEVKYLRIV